MSGRVLSILLALWFPAVSWSGPMVFTDRSTWMAALPAQSAVVTETFDVIADPDFPGAVPIASGSDLGLFTLNHDATADPTDLFNERLNLPVIFDESMLFGVENIFGGNLSTSGLDGRATYYDLEFGEGVLGFGADYTQTAGAFSQGLLLSVNGVLFDFGSILGEPGDGFLGIIDLAQPITSIRYTSAGHNPPAGNEAFLMDDFTVAVVAEPGVLALMLLCMGILWATSNFRNQKMRHRICLIE